jgi:hypothetical protein
LISWNSFDNQIYSFGKGPTATTVSASPKVTAYGTSVMIEGTVIDTSGGTSQKMITSRFPQGLPAVSEDSMEAWMEYAYMQQIKPTNATGVPVALAIIDGNGNYRTIGTAVSDMNGYYSFNWMPDVPGKYTVYATYAGSESYFASNAVSAFAVDPEVSTTSTPTPTQTPSMVEVYFLPAIIGVIVAIVIVGAVLALLVRKKP